MESVSQLILRNAAELPAGPLLLVNPPRDLLAQRLSEGNRPVRCVNQEFGDFQWQQGAGMEAIFAVVPTLGGGDGAVILFLPRERERLAMLLHAIADQMDPHSTLWLVGENRSGIKSAALPLQRHFRRVRSLDSARHCRLFEARSPTAEQPFRLDSYSMTWSTRYADRNIQLYSLPGVFAHGHLDHGTALLLQALEPLQAGGQILDFACGCGVVGLALLAASPRTDLTLLDSSAVAMESARQSLKLNGAQARLLPSDGLTELRKRPCPRYDWIISNPPFHRGVAHDLEVAEAFFLEAGTFLTENGKMVVVFNRHLPYSRWLRDAFECLEKLADTQDFTVVQVSRPTTVGKSAAARTASASKHRRNR